MAADDVRYPDITVDLTETDGNAMAVISRVSRALRRAGVERDEIAAFTDEAMSGDYDGVLRACMRWVNVS